MTTPTLCACATIKPDDMLYVDCDIHVKCDDPCLALTDPQTLEEMAKALEHWRNHGLYMGCSHGC